MFSGSAVIKEGSGLYFIMGADLKLLHCFGCSAYSGTTAAVLFLKFGGENKNMVI